MPAGYRLGCDAESGSDRVLGSDSRSGWGSEASFSAHPRPRPHRAPRDPGSLGAGPFVRDLKALSDLVTAPASYRRPEQDPAPAALPSASPAAPGSKDQAAPETLQGPRGGETEELTGVARLLVSAGSWLCQRDVPAPRCP